MSKLIILTTLLFYSLVNINSGYAKSSLHETALSFFSPLPKIMPNSEKNTQTKISLGKKLYFETALSINKSQSCNSCHNVLNGGAGVDNLTVSVGALGLGGSRNSPSTWNAGLHVAQFWDGRAKTLADQAKFPLLNPKEMAMSSETQIIKRLADKGYLHNFKQAFPKHALPINLINISQALSAFQKTLITKDRFDNYLAGDLSAIDENEKAGLAVFIEKGCVACHNGDVLGGQLFMKMGIVHPYPNKIDRGVAHVTGNPSDNYFFKVPSLRNILNTAPYFHDGASTTIEQAIIDTGWHQLGIKINDEEVEAIKLFFNTLNNQTIITRDDKKTK